mgnify:FL=1
MAELLALWLPILLITIALFILSSLLWTVIPLHTKDFKPVPDEPTLTNELKKQNLIAGQFLLPYRDNKADMASDAFRERYKAGPNALIRVWPGEPNMPRLLLTTLIYFLAVTTLTAYAAAVALQPGDQPLDVFQLTATIAILAYGAGGILYNLWFAQPLRPFITNAIEAALYALITAAILTLLWPAAPEAPNTLEASPEPSPAQQTPATSPPAPANDPR